MNNLNNVLQSPTKLLIIDTYFHLVKTMPCMQIKVHDICLHAKISKQAFNRHFSSIDDILVYLCHDKFSKLVDYLKKYEPKNKANFLEPYLTFWYKNSDILEIIFELEKESLLINVFKDIIIPYEKEMNIENNYLVEIRVAIMCGILKQWIKDNLQPDPITLSRTLYNQLNELTKLT